MQEPEKGSAKRRGRREGGGPVQCNAVLQCASAKTGAFEDRLEGLNDPQIIDSASDYMNEDRCIQKVKDRGLPGICDSVVVTPKVICLDPPGSNGCGSSPGDGTVIIVGSAASGDFKSDPQGTGGPDDGNGGDGAGGQGGR